MSAAHQSANVRNTTPTVIPAPVISVDGSLLHVSWAVPTPWNVILFTGTGPTGPWTQGDTINSADPLYDLTDFGFVFLQVQPFTDETGPFGPVSNMISGIF